jgi:hypothetical protein
MTAATQVGEESPGTTGERCRVTPGGPDASLAQGQCNREQTADV